jgi:hypothetical protein
LIPGEDFQPIGMGAERACAVYFDEAEDLLGIGGGKTSERRSRKPLPDSSSEG